MNKGRPCIKENKMNTFRRGMKGGRREKKTQIRRG
jgi:hypothetical protein